MRRPERQKNIISDATASRSEAQRDPNHRMHSLRRAGNMFYAIRFVWLRIEMVI